MLQLTFFLIVSIALTAVSWNSLRSPGSHGFYRFFAWEAILALVSLNAPAWFAHPLAWHQIISWCLLVACLLPLALGIHRLRMQGRPAIQRAGDPALLAFEKTTRLVSDGIYRYIRHPLYSSLLLLAWGAFFKSPSWIGGILAGAASLFLVFTARADEAECIRFFGADYREYMQHTKMFVPYLL
jgi:protein-S-isoprenylcysteine O-methyltransferase Ste14